MILFEKFRLYHDNRASKCGGEKFNTNVSTIDKRIMSDASRRFISTISTKIEILSYI